MGSQYLDTPDMAWEERQGRWADEADQEAGSQWQGRWSDEPYGWQRLAGHRLHDTANEHGWRGGGMLLGSRAAGVTTGTSRDRRT